MHDQAVVIEQLALGMGVACLLLFILPAGAVWLVNRALERSDRDERTH